MSLTIYKASAGSGKTFALSATFIAHLVSDDEIKHAHKHQLAVTFTNKATAEMKERILQYLFSLSHSDDDNDGFFCAVRELVPKSISNKAIRQRAGIALQSIIHDYDHFRVVTIDSFFQSLLSNMAHELGLASSFKVEIGDNDVLSKAVDRLLTHLEAGSEEMSHITEYIKERILEDKNWSVAHDLKSLAGEITKEPYMLNSNLLHSSAAGCVELTQGLVQKYKQTLYAYANSERQKLLKKAQLLNTLIESTLTYKGIYYGTNRVRPYIVQLADPGKRFRDLKEPTDSFRRYANGSTPLLSGDNAKNATMAAQAQTVLTALDDLVKQCDDSFEVANTCDLCLSNINPLLLLDAIDREVRKLNDENDRIMLAYTPMLFHGLTGKSDTSFIFERAGTQYHHVMIDEFQDTSKLQWENMHHLLVENMAQGNSCMLVGDVKQGIYRFRGGDWNMLAGFRQGYDATLNTHINIKMLDKNFRSGRNIVEFNNSIFVAAAHVVNRILRQRWQITDGTPNDPTRDIEKIYPTPDPENDSHEVTQISHHPGGYVRVQLINEDVPEDAKGKGKKGAATETTGDKEGFCVEASMAEQMWRLNKSGVPFNRMAILLRKRGEANRILEYFEEHYPQGTPEYIPLISEEAFLLESSEAVQTIISVLRHVANPEDEIARVFVEEHSPEASRKETLDTVNGWCKARFTPLPFYEMSCTIIRLFGLDNMEGQSPYIYCFLDNVLQYMEDNTSDIAAFLKYWDETLHGKAIPSAAVRGVRLLTIHKSKGLDFHTVFIPFCNWKIEDHTELLWLMPSKAPYNNIPLLPVSMVQKADKSIFKEAYRQEVFDKHVENLNLMYVAFTRTRQNLLIWADCMTLGTVGTMLRDAVIEAGLKRTPAESYGSIVEIGSPSALECEPKDKEKEKQEKSKQKEVANPLAYDPEGVELDFVHHEPRLTFLQSNSAQVFLDIPSEDETAKGKPSDAEGKSGNADGQSGNANGQSGNADGNKTSGARQTEDAEAQAARETYRKTGILLHMLMSAIENAEDVDARVDAFDRAGMLPANLSADSVKRLIRRRISEPTARDWFDGSWRLFRECTLLFKDENGNNVQRRPDRVMTRGNRADGTDETVVVDFKFGRASSDYEGQVKQYMELLRRQGSSKVRGYLWYLYNGNIKEVYLD